MNTKDIEEFKYLIDSRQLSNSDKKKEIELLNKLRLERYLSRTESDIQTIKLLQLKYQIKQ